MSVKRFGGIAAVAVIACGVGYIVAQSQVNSAAEESVRKMADKIEANADNGLKIDFKSVDAPIFGDNISVIGVTLNDKDGNPVFGMESVGVAAEGFVENEKFPTFADFSISEFEVVNEQVKAELNQGGLGYGDRTLDVAFGYDFDKDADTLTSYSSMSVPKMSDTSASLTVSGVAGIWDVMEANYAENEGKIDLEYKERRNIQQMFRDIRVNDEEVIYENNGEIEQVVETVAAEEGLSVEQVNTRLPDMIDFYAGGSPFAGELKKFVADPVKLSVALNPAEPIAPAEFFQRFMMASMGNTEKALDGFGLEVKAN